MKRSNDILTISNRNWKFQANGKYVGLFGLYNAVGDFHFRNFLEWINEPGNLMRERVSVRAHVSNGVVVRLTAIAK